MAASIIKAKKAREREKSGKKGILGMEMEREKGRKGGRKGRKVMHAVLWRGNSGVSREPLK